MQVNNSKVLEPIYCKEAKFWQWPEHLFRFSFELHFESYSSNSCNRTFCYIFQVLGCSFGLGDNGLLGLRLVYTQSLILSDGSVYTIVVAYNLFNFLIQNIHEQT